MSKKGMEITVNFIISLVLILIVVAVIALWLFFGDEGGLKGRLVNYISTNIFPK